MNACESVLNRYESTYWMKELFYMTSLVLHLVTSQHQDSGAINRQQALLQTHLVIPPALTPGVSPGLQSLQPPCHLCPTLLSLYHFHYLWSQSVGYTGAEEPWPPPLPVYWLCCCSPPPPLSQEITMKYVSGFQCFLFPTWQIALVWTTDTNAAEYFMWGKWRKRWQEKLDLK